MTGDGLLRDAPRAVGLDARAVEAFLDEAAAANLEIHSLMIHRRDRVVVEGWRWPYHAARPRMTHSFTKSITACAIGLAIDEGYFKLTDTVVSFFPDELPPVVDDKLKTMTVEDLLTMRTGHAAETSGAVWRGIKTSWIAEFFKIPIVTQPGTTFVYTSAASYMLSAILTKTTGMTMHAFLKPRLLEPMGITGETWDVGPDGINPGGNGFTCTTANMLKFGVLHAQGGLWEGRRLLPAAWVAAATQRHGGNNYGYHWVAAEDGLYYALGIFVQMAVVIPAAGATINLTCAIENSKLLLPILRKHLPGAFHDAPLEDAGTDARLSAHLAALAVSPKLSGASSPRAQDISGRTYRAAPNTLGITDLSFDFTPGRCVFRLTDGDGTHTVTMGLTEWVESTTGIPGRDLHHGYALRGAVVVAGAVWCDSDTLEMTWIFAETAFRDTVLCRFKGDTVTLDRSVNINSGLRSLPTLHGSRA